ncbi:hypothetical protein IT409_01055 [Candidatus Falkowbacteria bacterium]|nr:hypothetical protein [Candidatus Falkowbacteria bacterium]
MKFTRLTSLLVAGIITFSPLATLAQTVPNFDPSFILSNNDLDDHTSMSLGDISAFLTSQNSFLGSYTTIDTDGFARSAAEIIYLSAHANKINPRWILVTLQKEQSLVLEQSSPIQDRLDWAMGYGVCDSCSKDDPGIQKFRGFAKQVRSASARIRYYLSNPHQFNFKAGETYTIDNQIVTIKNQATATFYNYTPHIHGNQNFVKIWSRWFKKSFPSGTLVQVPGEKGVWLIVNGSRKAISSQAVLFSRFAKRQILPISTVDLLNYPVSTSIRFPNFSLVGDQTGTRYLLVDDQKKPFESLEVFAKLGFNEEEIEWVLTTDLEDYKLGNPLTLASAYPLGQLLQDTKSGGVYFVQDGIKHPIIDKSVLAINFPKRSISKATPESLALYPTGDKIRINDTTLIKSPTSPSVYVVSDGNKLPILDEKTFTTLGYSWNSIKTVPDAVLALHPTGEALGSQSTISIATTH